MAVARGLRRRFGAERHRHKLAARLANASPGTAAGWLQGRKPPEGLHLARLMARADEVLEEVLSLIGRGELARRAHVLRRIKKAEAFLQEATAMLARGEENGEENAVAE